ncbi:unnamed protein product [Adineta ricciae]|uniref:Receptor for retinol uptake STRA6 n=1 Tax=Adineta ricciae TaxID=249248 RepID=A0A813NSS9_ADIRI|nr:unnamed protein product [Adineta ricciae]
MPEDLSSDENVIMTSTISESINCSVYNPCGRNGYCLNTDEDEQICSCKFWWNGATCNEMSNGGKQVITLGIILAVLLAAFYGLGLFRRIRKKRNQPKQKQEPSIPIVRLKFPTVPVEVFDPSRRKYAWTTGILTFIFAMGTLVVKWSILKPIHDEVVYKYENNQSVYFNTHSVCPIINFRADFNIFTFPIACLLILLFVIITKRVSSRHNRYCKGYFGIVIPLDFFGHVKRTLAAVIFAVFADELLDIANELLAGGRKSSNQGVIITYLTQIFRVFVIGFRRYPILAAVYMDNYFTLICGTLYAWLDFTVAIMSAGLCTNNFYQTKEQFNKTGSNRTAEMIAYYGTGPKLLFLQLFLDVPRYFCLSYLCVKLPMVLIKRIRHRNIPDKQMRREQKDLLYSSLPHSAEARYVKKLFGYAPTEPPKNRLSQILRRIYAWRDDFRFSSRVICVYASIFLLLFFLTVSISIRTLPILDKIHPYIQAFADLFAIFITFRDPVQADAKGAPPDFPVPDLTVPLLISIYVALLVIIIQLLFMLASIRRNLLQSYRGDHREIPPRVSTSNVSYCTGSFHFAGYLIGYVIIGYALILFVSIMLTMSIAALIIYASVPSLERFLTLVIPPILFTTFKLYINKFLSQYVFLQHSGEVLSINNRRALMVFLYFNFFLDTFLGFFAAFFRILKSIIGGMFYMCRLDYSPLGRKLETMDAGFNAYCGLIYMETAHRHPVLLFFVSHLLRDHLYPTKRLSKARHNWYLAIFLLNNPTLIYQRKDFLRNLHDHDTKIMLIGRRNMKKLSDEPLPAICQPTDVNSAKEYENRWHERRF